MKAMVFHGYGSPDVLKLEDVEKPVPGDHDVLIEVRAASVNPLDWHLLRGSPFPVRLMSGMLKPKFNILGVDAAGRVEAVGQRVTRFQPGDELFGSRLGSFAEYLCLPESKAALKPPGVSYEAAAAVPVAAITALQGLRDKGQIRAGHKVLINGASGGVGTFAVQIAKWFDTEVTAVCSTRNLELVRSVGSDHTVDYTQTDFAHADRHYDLIFDVVGKRSFADCKRALNPQGVFVSMGMSFMGLARSMAASQRMVLMGMANINEVDLELLKELLEAGKIAPVIDRRYALSDVPEAIRYLETERARGKVVISMDT